MVNGCRSLRYLISHFLSPVCQSWHIGEEIIGRTEFYSPCYYHQPLLASFLAAERGQPYYHDFVFEYSCRFFFWVDLHDSAKLNTVYSRSTHFVSLRYTVSGMFICRFLRRRLAVDLSLLGKRCRSAARLRRLPRPRKDANAKPDFSLWRPHRRRPIYVRRSYAATRHRRKRHCYLCPRTVSRIHGICVVADGDPRHAMQVPYSHEPTRPGRKPSRGPGLHVRRSA